VFDRHMGIDFNIAEGLGHDHTDHFECTQRNCSLDDASCAPLVKSVVLGV